MKKLRRVVFKLTFNKLSIRIQKVLLTPYKLIKTS